MSSTKDAIVAMQNLDRDGNVEIGCLISAIMDEYPGLIRWDTV